MMVACMQNQKTLVSTRVFMWDNLPAGQVISWPGLGTFCPTMFGHAVHLLSFALDSAARFDLLKLDASKETD